MDKELAKLQKEIIKRLIAYEDELTALKRPNALKKTKRVAGSAAWNIAAFPDLVQNLLDSGIPTSQIVTKLKYFQEKLLKDVEQIKGTETGHHKTGLRTGGSFYKADPEIWQPTVSRLADFFETEFGDVLTNIDSLLNWTHKSDTNVKGIEKALNIGANPIKELTAHPLGTTARFISGELSPEILSDPDKLFDALAARIDQQQQAAKIARTVQQPLEQAVQTFAPQAYKAPTIEASKQVQALTALPENRLIIEQGILDTVKGSAKLKFLIPKVGVLAAAGAVLDVGGVQAAVQQAQEPMGTRESLATALEGVSSAAGLASLTPAAPIAGPVSLATGAAAMAVRGKAEQKIPQALEKIQEVQQQVFPLQGMLNQLVPKFINGAMRLAMP
jgi:hypothetical protein